VTGLTNGTPYYFSIYASNAIGAGIPSDISSTAVTPNTTAPDTAPTITSMVAGYAKVTVSYTAPTSNGGETITSYTVNAYTSLSLSSLAKSATLTTATPATPSPIDVSGLTIGTPYYFSIYASNIRGAGISSDISSTAVIPAAKYTAAADNLTDASFSNLISLKAPLHIFSPYVASTLTNNNTQMKDERSGYTGTASMSGIIVNKGAIGGAAADITYLSGTTTSTINFPSGSKPSAYTICSVTKYSNVTNATRQRILQDYSSAQWIHGHHGGNAGVFHNPPQTWMTNYSMNVTNATDWVVLCSRTNATETANNILVNNVSIGLVRSIYTSGPYALTINGQNYEPSNFDFAYLYVWNQELTYDEMTTVSKKMLLYLRTGIM
jgi:hypothetical protein